VPLSGGNGAITRSDSQHKTIFNEAKRDASLLSMIRFWAKCNEYNTLLKKKDRIPTIIMLPTTDGKKIIDKSSDLWCFHSDDSEAVVKFVTSGVGAKLFEWEERTYPACLTLYHNTYEIWKSSVLDKDKKVMCCSIASHNQRGWWFIVDKNKLEEWWALILAARIEREAVLKEQGLI
jgi:hypothetical protein